MKKNDPADALNRPSEQELQRLRALHAYGVLDSGPEIEFDDIAKLAAEICGTPIALVSLVDADRQWFKASFGLDVRETPREQSFCAHAVTSGSRLVVPSASKDERFSGNPFVTGSPGIRFYAGEPLIAPGGEVLGTLCVIDRVERELTASQSRALSLLAREVMTHLELRRSLAELRVSEERYRTMFEANPQPMWAYDLETLAFLAVNDAAVQSYGYSREEFMRMTIKDIRPQEDIGRLTENIRRVSEGLDRAGIWKHRTKQGKGILVEITSHTINYGGRPAEIVTALDVTERLETEERIEKLNRLHVISSGINEAIVRITDSYELCEATCRIAVDGGMGMAWFGVEEIDDDMRMIRTVAVCGEESDRVPDFIPIDELCDGAPGPARSAINEGGARVSVGKNLPPDWEGEGDLAYEAKAAFGLRWEGGRRGVFVVYADDADYFAHHRLGLWTALVENLSFAIEAHGMQVVLRLAAAEKSAMAKEISMERKRLVEAQAVAKVGSWETDLKSMKVVWSDEAYRIFGKEPGVLEPSHERFLEMVHDSDRTMVERAFEESLEQLGSQNLEHRIVTDAGELKVVEERWKVFADVNGAPVRAVGTVLDITNRKNAEEERARLFNLSMDLLGIADFDGFLEQMNPAWSECLGWSAEELAGRPWMDLVHPDDLDRTIRMAEELYSGEPVRRFEVRFVRKDGDYRWLSWSVYPLRETRQLFGIGRDVTSRKRLEEEADLLEMRLGRTLESISDAFFTLDRDWRFKFLNSEVERLLNRSREDLLGGVIWDLFPDEVGGTFQKQYERALTENETVSFEEYYGILDKWFEVRAYPAQEGLSVYFRDITERRKTENQLRLLETCVSKLNDSILITEADPISEPGPRIIFANDTFIEKIGFPKDEVLGKSPRFLQGPKTQRDALDRIRNALSRQEPVREELINYTKDGKEIHLDIDIVPIFDPDGKCRHFAAIQRDITEKKDLERQVLRAQRMESIGTLAGGIAHDLNNILAPIVLAIDLLREYVEDPEGLETLDLIASSAERGADMVNQVLAFARGVDSDVKTVLLSEVTKDLERIVKDTFPKNIRFEIRADPDLWAVRGDATQIHQVLLNLCVNSRDAMPDGGDICVVCENVYIDHDLIEIDVASKPGPYLRVDVIDNGSGIDEDVIDKLFDPFFTTKDIGSGTGLGLSTSLAIVKSHGGFMRVESSPGEGACFRVFLPAVTEPAGASPAEATGKIPLGKGETILVIDDEPGILNMVRKTLEDSGYKVMTAKNGAEAVTIYGRNRKAISAVLTDMMMPVMDGPATIRALFELEPDLKVMASSGINTDAKVRESAMAGVRHFLPKPYKTETLLRTLAELLDEETGLDNR